MTMTMILDKIYKCLDKDQTERFSSRLYAAMHNTPTYAERCEVDGAVTHEFVEVFDDAVVELQLGYDPKRKWSKFTKRFTIYADGVRYNSLIFNNMFHTDWFKLCQCSDHVRRLVSMFEHIEHAKFFSSVDLYRNHVEANAELSLGITPVVVNGATVYNVAAPSEVDRNDVNLQVIIDYEHVMTAREAIIAARHAREVLHPELANINTLDDVLRYVDSKSNVLYHDHDYLVVKNLSNEAGMFFTTAVDGRPLLLSNHNQRTIICDGVLHSKLNTLYSKHALVVNKRLSALKLIADD